tara:strand:+ start:14419 stop:15282 length:864 start_codon:yes stop_codon:yes gene_type:complete
MILILGKSGYIGKAFVEEAKRRNIEYNALSRSEVDYTNYEELNSFFLKIGACKYDVVINCAGFIGKPNVDACETRKAETIAGNVVFPVMLSNLCARFGAIYCHISSGCIYNGYDKEYTEEDPPNFCFKTNNGSFYSGTKALAEELINRDKTYVCRLRIPFDHINSPRNYLSKLLNYDKLLDMKNSVSHRYDFVNACYDLIKKKAPYGIYNIVNSGFVSTAQVVQIMHRYLNINKNFDFFESEQQFYEIGASAPRSNCILDNSKLLSTGVNIRTTEEALAESLTRWRK